MLQDNVWLKGAIISSDICIFFNSSHFGSLNATWTWVTWASQQLCESGQHCLLLYKQRRQGLSACSIARPLILNGQKEGCFLNCCIMYFSVSVSRVASNLSHWCCVFASSCWLIGELNQTKEPLNERLKSLLLEPRKGLSQLMQIRGNFSGNMVCTMLNGIRNYCRITYPSSSLSDLKGTQVISRRAENLMPAGLHCKSSLKSSKHQFGAFYAIFTYMAEFRGLCSFGKPWTFWALCFSCWSMKRRAGVLTESSGVW